MNTLYYGDNLNILRDYIWHRDYPRMQILSVEEVLAMIKIEMPSSVGPFKQAEKMSSDSANQNTLGFE